MEEADQLSDRISIIDHGKIIVTGSAEELKNKLGKDLIYLETSNNKIAAEILRSLKSVKTVTEDTKSLRVMIGENVTHVLPQIMEKIREEGIDITTVNIKKPSMDDVFVHYTGHGLREGDTKEKYDGMENSNQYSSVH
jgi:ABC-2 type transport system ATP-binding protein